jgi:cytochrome c oxidase subunit 1
MIRSPQLGADLWIVGLATAGLGTILGAVNFITTIITLRAPGMTMFRMPIFTWNILVTSILVLFAFPVITGAFFALLADRHLGAQIYNVDAGGAILWQHLFWFFGHPEVYIIACPSSASSPRSSRCSAASRCSATRAWSSPPSPSAPCR